MGSLEKKHVLLVVRWPVGGIRTFIRYVYRNFDPLRWRFTILAPDLEEMRVLMTDLQGLDVAFVPIKGMPIDGSSGAMKLLRAITVLLANQRYDLVHSHGFIAGMCVAAPAFVRRVPHLLTSHDVINEIQFSGLLGMMRHFAMNTCFSMIDTIHSVSHDAQANLKSFFPRLSRKKGKCVVIPNGIEVKRFLSAAPRNLRKESALGENSFLIGFFGRFMAQKGFRYLVDAINMLKNQQLPKKPIVLCFGSGGFIREEQEILKNRGLQDSFLFLPFSENVAGAIKGVDVVVMPSLWEACGLLAMETMVCGTPLIGSNCIGLREVIKETPAKYTNVKDSAGLAELITKEIQNPTKEVAIIFSADAANRFDVQKQYLLLLNLYQTMLTLDV